MVREPCISLMNFSHNRETQKPNLYLYKQQKSGLTPLHAIHSSICYSNNGREFPTRMRGGGSSLTRERRRPERGVAGSMEVPTEGAWKQLVSPPPPSERGRIAKGG
ncbi:hypothetical protein CDAR_104241 [Caerostris darwini]|uniref:Uncharacterized protein n=1 Tax=Caerostris darwini TaxID=1538125 RepID=A0AAV4PUK4_9ARAC|nr:hypothetical protein CDAR_104241 [Caerostris darwini]